MSSSMPWSLLPASQCAPPQWKTLTHQLPLVAQQDSSCPHQGKFHNRWSAVCGHVFFLLSFSLFISRAGSRWRWGRWIRGGCKQGDNGPNARTFAYSYLLVRLAHTIVPSPLNLSQLKKLFKSLITDCFVFFMLIICFVFFKQQKPLLNTALTFPIPTCSLQG